ncbi:MAG: CGNR zinc finger domain-containing protein [Actinomycetes bacterium]
MPDRSDAPGALEDVRTFLNTWSVPNETRVPVDRLSELAGDPETWGSEMPSLPPPARGGVAALRRLRDDLREALGQDRPVSLQPRLDGLRLRALVPHAGGEGPGGKEPDRDEPDRDEPAVRLVPERPTTQAWLLCVVLEAVRQGQWQRLRACPDCRWVFYDSSRNARRTWCSMSAGPGTRGCGSIAKTRTYRARRR